MGDRIEIRDSVVMGNVGSVSSGTSPLSCNSCQKMGNIVLHLCLTCNSRFCGDCNDPVFNYYPPFDLCRNCGTEWRKDIANYVGPIYEIIYKYPVNQYSRVAVFDISCRDLIRASNPNHKDWFNEKAKNNIRDSYVKLKGIIGDMQMEDIEFIFRADSPEQAKLLCFSSSKSDWPSILEKGRLEENQRKLERWKAETREKWKNVLLNEWTMVFIVFVVGMIWFNI